MKKQFVQTFIFTVFSLLCLVFSANSALAATTGSAIPAFLAFEKSVMNGQAGLVRGVYIPELFALPIQQQPSSNPLFVSEEPGVLTDFKTAHDQGSVGLLAHNYLAGRDFASIKPGQEAILVYGDGKLENFVVTHIYQINI